MKLLKLNNKMGLKKEYEKAVCIVCNNSFYRRVKKPCKLIVVNEKIPIRPCNCITCSKKCGGAWVYIRKQRKYKNE